MKPFVAILLTVAACGGDDDTSTNPLPENAQTVVENYAAIVHASYLDSHSEAQKLETANATMVTNCQAGMNTCGDDLKAAQTAWLAAREPYLQTEVYRFYGGPIDVEPGGPEGLINAWPMDENFIDYIDDNGTIQTGGIIYGNQTIDAPTLEGLNGEGGDANVATGYHAIEFLLWGQDLDPDGPGARKGKDYNPNAQNNPVGEEQRRGLYLNTVSTMLVGHLQDMVDAWADGSTSNYRGTFVAKAPEESVRDILIGMIKLSGFETGGERLQTAYMNMDQEDEHSCFSDNTHRDMIQDVQGVLNVWNGSYTKLDNTTVSGPGIKDLVTATDADLANQIDEKLSEALANANALQVPFDKSLTDTAGREKILALITSLQDVEKLLEQVFNLYGFEIPPNP